MLVKRSHGLRALSTLQLYRWTQNLHLRLEGLFQLLDKRFLSAMLLDVLLDIEENQTIAEGYTLLTAISGLVRLYSPLMNAS